jgi:hypothetical protein
MITTRALFRNTARTSIAVAAIGLSALTLTSSAAQAAPLNHQAPARSECNQFGFPGDTIITLGSGNKFDFVASNPAKLDNNVLFVPKDGSAQRKGTITGTINGRAVHMQTIVGNDVANFDGAIGTDGRASGSVFNLPTPNDKVFWEIKNTFPCLDSAASVDSHFATATIDLDLYKAAGGRDRDKLDKFLKKGSKVQVVKACTSNDWCELADHTFAWGEFLRNK